MPGKVLRIITRLNRGGPLRQLCALVPGLQQHGWHGPVLCGHVEHGESDGTAELEAVGAHVIRLRSLRRGIDVSKEMRAFRGVLAAIRHHRPDLVHTHTGKAGALGRIAACIQGVPTVHTYHGHHLDSAFGIATVTRRAEQGLARLTNAAIALTPRQHRDLVEVHRILRPETVRVIAPGMDLDGFRQAAQRRVPADLLPAADPGVPRFLWTGRFAAVKAPRLLVEAVAHAKERFHVTMLGRGALLRSVRATIRAHGLEARMACPGSVVDVAPWLQQADALVLCSRSEGAPLSVIEAMALGKPVVVPTVGGLPDMVTHEGTGLWVQPGDPLALARALDRMARDAALRERLGAAGREAVEARFGGARLAAETAALYDTVIG